MLPASTLSNHSWNWRICSTFQPSGAFEQAGRHIALGEVLQLHRLPPQRDVDGHDDLLDRAEAVGLVRARVARQVEQLVAGQQLPRPAVDHLLEGRRRRPRAAPGLVEQELDRGAVDDIETDDLAAAVAAQLERRRIEHQNVFEQLAQPGRERPLAVRPAPEIGKRRRACRRVRGRNPCRARLDRPVELFDLVLAGLDRQARDVMGVGQRAQFVERDRLISGRPACSASAGSNRRRGNSSRRIATPETRNSARSRG